MGILRTLLALAVIVFHSYKIFGLRMCGGQVAVQSFYIISGFYMALILNQKYTGAGSYITFLKSRFFRIFPVYWFVLFCALTISVFGYSAFDKPYYLARYFANSGCLSGLTIFYFVLENIIVIGQDILYFLRMNEFCVPVFSYHPLSYNHNAYQYLLVPQAWSISIECVFYLLAPFLVRKKLKWQVAVIICSLILRMLYVTCFNLSFDPWTYRFFPFEIALFLAGSVAYYFYKKYEYKVADFRRVGIFLLFTLTTAVIFYNEIEIDETIKSYSFYFLLTLSIPFIFNAVKNSAFDRYIGELSFSLYIVHHIVVSVMRGWFFSHINYISYYGYAVLTASIIIAIFLQRVLIRRIEVYRHKRFC